VEEQEKRHSAPKKKIASKDQGRKKEKKKKEVLPRVCPGPKGGRPSLAVEGGGNIFRGGA